MNVDMQVKKWGQVVAKAQQDDEFRKRLLSEPNIVVKECGLNLPDGVQLQVHQNTDQVVHLTIPAKSAEAELSDAELAGVSGGALSIIAILIGLLRPSAQGEGTTYDPARVFSTNR